MRISKNQVKRGLALFLALVMCLGMLNLTAFAFDGVLFPIVVDEELLSQIMPTVDPDEEQTEEEIPSIAPSEESAEEVEEPDTQRPVVPVPEENKGTENKIATIAAAGDKYTVTWSYGNYSGTSYVSDSTKVTNGKITALTTPP